MNSAVILVVISALNHVHSNVPDVHGERKSIFPRLLPLPILVRQNPSEEAPQHHRHVKGVDEGRKQDASHSSGDQSHSAGGSSKSHQESGKHGDELKEVTKKDYGEHKGRHHDYHNVANAHVHSGLQAGKKHHAKHKGKARKKNKKVSKWYSPASSAPQTSNKTPQNEPTSADTEI